MIDSESHVTAGPASSALEPPRARRLIVGILVGAGLLIAALVYLYGVFQAVDLLKTNPDIRWPICITAIGCGNRHTRLSRTAIGCPRCR